ncbi:hypothetical protein U1T56_08575 [Geminicoccaceae bacterium SYSU G07066]|uniref:PEP-CTERM protein-sorting domain-containing protein n=1 Tax=Benzoatithermus flavus TaxID=3108223 RepID=A0ABU8XS08_9PROT
MALAPAEAAAAVHATAEAEGPDASPDPDRRYPVDHFLSLDRFGEGIGVGDLTTYRYVQGSGPGGIDLDSFLAMRQAFANLSFQDREPRPAAAISYSVVPGSEAYDIVSPLPAAALLLGSALGGLGALAWRQHRRGSGHTAT